MAVPEEAARKGMLSNGLPEIIVDAILGWFAYCRAGKAAHVNPIAAQLLGRQPRSAAQWAAENVHLYQ